MRSSAGTNRSAHGSASDGPPNHRLASYPSAGRLMPIASRDFRELRLEGVCRDFGQMRALRDVTLTVKRGEFVALLGPSGCGKSTALNCISGLLEVTGGAILVAERRVGGVGSADTGL